MTKAVLPIHAEDHRPVGWFGPADPGGPDPLTFGGPAPWVRRRYTSGGRPLGPLVCSDQNDVVLSYNDAGDPDSAEIQGSDDWRDYFDIDNAFQTNLLVPGQVTFSGKVRWASFGNGHESFWVLNDGGSFAEVVGYVKFLGELSADSHGFTFVHRQPLGMTWLAALAQQSGGAKTIAAAYLEMRFDGTYTGPDTNDVNDPDPVE